MIIPLLAFYEIILLYKPATSFTSLLSITWLRKTSINGGWKIM